MSSDCDSWMTRQQLEILGVAKLVNDMDSKEAARLGLMTRPLTTAAIEKHLDDFGLEPEFSTHSLMKGLSGGQKVKVVLAAAMWNNPHILVMDEPTNFLDRDSLGALAMVRCLRCCGCCVVSPLFQGVLVRLLCARYSENNTNQPISPPRRAVIGGRSTIFPIFGMHDLDDRPNESMLDLPPNHPNEREWGTAPPL